MLSALPLLLRNYSFHGSSTLLSLPSINCNVVFERNSSSSSSSSDPYTKIIEQPREVVESLAETLELRAAEEQQTLLRERWQTQKIISFIVQGPCWNIWQSVGGGQRNRSSVSTSCKTSSDSGAPPIPLPLIVSQC